MMSRGKSTPRVPQDPGARPSPPGGARAWLPPISRRGLIGAALALLLCRRAHAQDIEIIALRHRPADELLPTLRAFLEPGGALTGQGYQLFLRTSPANARQLKQLLATLDRAPRELLITVRHDREGEGSERRVGADGSVTITTRRVWGELNVDAADARTIRTQSAEQRIRVVEGGRAYIAIGTAIPMSFRRFVTTPQGLTEVRGTVYYDAVTGFYARPQLAGELVTVELAPEQSNIVAGGIERAQLSTTVRGRLGEWIAVGGVDARGESSTSGMLSSTQRTDTGQRGVWLKVEEVGAPPR